MNLLTLCRCSLAMLLTKQGARYCEHCDRGCEKGARNCALCRTFDHQTKILAAHTAP
jgi:hypothetical protein